MEILVIGKPAMNVYLPLQEYPEEGDLFLIKNKSESLGNVGATSACLLGKWNLSVNFTGVVGNDAYAEKIRDTFQTNNVKSKFLEVNYEHGTSVNYNVLNAKTGIVTKILYNNPAVELTKYKYDFIPEYAIIDGTDLSGAYALLNNNSNVKTVFYGRIGDKDSITLSKRCSYVICTQTFAEMMSKYSPDGTAESYVNLYQKIVDAAGASNYIIILNNHKILYSVDGQVKMMPEMKINVVDYSSFDSIFTGAFAFAYCNNLIIDDAIKFANTAAAISLGRIGESTAIPDINEVLDNSGLREKMGKSESPQVQAQAVPVAPMNVNQSASVSSNETPVINNPLDSTSTSIEEPITPVITPKETVSTGVMETKDSIPITENTVNSAISAEMPTTILQTSTPEVLNTSPEVQNTPMINAFAQTPVDNTPQTNIIDNNGGSTNV